MATADLWTDYWTDTWGVLVWQPLTKTDPGAERHMDYAAVLEGRGVLGTMRGAFDAMVALVP